MQNVDMEEEKAFCFLNPWKLIQFLAFEKLFHFFQIAEISFLISKKIVFLKNIKEHRIQLMRT